MSSTIGHNQEQYGCVTTLSFHPHSHCVVTGGDRSIRCQSGFLLTVRVLSHRFRHPFLDYLEGAFR